MEDFSEAKVGKYNNDQQTIYMVIHKVHTPTVSQDQLRKVWLLTLFLLVALEIGVAATWTAT